jgi:hypothetical protein
MTGLPQGQLEVKYYADYELEAVIAARLFPGGTIRPKVFDLAKMVEQYVGADESFKELWMLFIMSIVVAPTTDNKMSNKCYPMLVITFFPFISVFKWWLSVLFCVCVYLLIWLVCILSPGRHCSSR